MLIYQTLYFAQLIIFQGGGRFQSFIDEHDVRATQAQSASHCLLRFFYS